jgi:hypothetical protein
MIATNWIDEAEALAKAATPGPWAQNGPEHAAHQVYTTGLEAMDDWMVALTMEPKDAAHIAYWHPERVRKVLAALRAYRALLRSAETLDANWEETYTDTVPSSRVWATNEDTALQLRATIDHVRGELKALEEP